MTGRLNFVLQFRDAQVAEDVRKKAELGWFEQEFTMYGTAYLNDGEMCYKISADAGKIYAFIEASSRQQIFCSNVLTHTRTLAVPIGEKEETALAVKKETACLLRRAYPPEFFRLLAQLAEDIRTDAAYPWLCAQRETLEGIFDERRLAHFQDLVQHCYSAQKLSPAHCRELLDWVHQQYLCMLDDFVSKDRFEKSFYGIAYASGSGFRYLHDSLPEYICQRQAALEEKGVFVSPVFAQTLWYNYTYDLAACRQDYDALLKATLSPDMLKQLQIILRGPQYTPRPSFIRTLQDMGPQAQDAFNRHLGRWGVTLG